MEGMGQRLAEPSVGSCGAAGCFSNGWKNWGGFFQPLENGGKGRERGCKALGALEMRGGGERRLVWT